MGLLYWQYDRELATLAYLALYADGAAMLVDDVAHYRQTDTRTGLVIGSLIERLEDALAILLDDADAIVLHLNAEVTCTCLLETAHTDAALRVLVGIAQQVAHHLGQSLSIDDGRKVLVRIIDGKLSPALLECRGEAFADVVHQLADVVGSKVHRHVLLLHLTEIQQLVHQLQQPMGVAVNHL